MSVTIVLDAGHGGYDNGASYLERKEKEDVLKLTMAVGEMLEDDGYDVIYTRTSDVYDSPFAKAQIANNSGADYFISFHRNASPYPNTYKGVQALVYGNSPEAEKIGTSINTQLEETGFKNLGIDERPGLVVLRRTKMPAVLLEVGFLNTDSDNELFDSKFEEIAAAIAQGIENSIPLKSPAQGEGKYTVQIGLFKYYENAVYLLEQVQGQGYTGTIEYVDPYYAVWIGNFNDLDSAVSLGKRLREMGYDTLVVKES